MRLQIEVWNAAGTARLGEGPILTARNASVTRRLDGAGDFEFSVPATDKRALDLLQNERQVRIFVEWQGTRREWGRGIVRQLAYDAQSTGQDIKVTGPDTLDALARIVVGRTRKFTNEAIEDIASTLVGLVGGWSVTAEAGLGSQSAQFSGANVLKAIIRMVEEKGIHLREGEIANTIEVGAFGAQSTAQIVGVGSATREMHHNPDIMFVDRLAETRTTRGIVNRVYPLGAGEGEAALTLKLSTRSTPYTVQNRTVGGRIEYYLEDEQSVADYGVTEKYLVFKEIAPLANTDTAKIYAANALYDAAAAWLERSAVEQRTYRVSVKKPETTIRPGDKVRITYKGDVYREGVRIMPVDVDDWFWVMSVTERIGIGDATLDLDVSIIDRAEEDEAKTVVSALEAIEVRNVAVQTYPNTFKYVYYDSLQNRTDAYADKWAEFKLPVDAQVTEIVKVSISFVTKPLYITGYYDLFGALYSQDNLYGAYQIFTSTKYPRDVSLWINGVDVSTQLGGPWATGGSAQAEVDDLDVTSFILNASGGMYQKHSIVFKCGYYTEAGTEVVLPYTTAFSGVQPSSMGWVEVTLSVMAICQAIFPE